MKKCLPVLIFFCLSFAIFISHKTAYAYTNPLGSHTIPAEFDIYVHDTNGNPVGGIKTTFAALSQNEDSTCNSTSNDNFLLYSSPDMNTWLSSNAVGKTNEVIQNTVSDPTYSNGYQSGSLVGEAGTPVQYGSGYPGFRCSCGGLEVLLDFSSNQTYKGYKITSVYGYATLGLNLGITNQTNNSFAVGSPTAASDGTNTNINNGTANSIDVTIAPVPAHGYHDDTSGRSGYTLNQLYSSSDLTSAGVPSGGAGDQSCNAQEGWACDPNSSSSHLQVRLYNGDKDAGGTYIGAVTASMNRLATPWPLSGVCGTNDHGWIWDIPNNLKSNTAQNIYAYGVEEDGVTMFKLENTPQAIPANCPVQNTTQNTTPPPTTPPPPPPSCYISVNPNPVTQLFNAVLGWGTNGTSATISGPGTNVSWSPGQPNSKVIDTRDVGDRTYSMTAYGSGGSSYCSATLTVNPNTSSSVGPSAP